MTLWRFDIAEGVKGAFVTGSEELTRCGLWGSPAPLERPAFGNQKRTANGDLRLLSAFGGLREAAIRRQCLGNLNSPEAMEYSMCSDCPDWLLFDESSVV